MSERLDLIRDELMAGAQRSVATSDRRRRRRRVAAGAAAVLAVSASTAYATGLISLTPANQSTLNEQTALFARLMTCTPSDDGTSIPIGLTDPKIVRVLHFNDTLTGAPVEIGINKENAAFIFVDGPNADAVARRIEHRGPNAGDQVMHAIDNAGLSNKITATYGVTRWAKTATDGC